MVILHLVRRVLLAWVGVSFAVCDSKIWIPFCRGWALVVVFLVKWVVSICKILDMWRILGFFRLRECSWDVWDTCAFFFWFDKAFVFFQPLICQIWQLQKFLRITFVFQLVFRRARGDRFNADMERGYHLSIITTLFANCWSKKNVCFVLFCLAAGYALVE